ALVPHLDGLAVPALVLADADAFRVIAVSADGEVAAIAAAVLVAVLVVALAFLGAAHALLHDLPQLLEAAHGLDLLLLLLGEEAIGEPLQPLGRDVLDLLDL